MEIIEQDCQSTYHIKYSIKINDDGSGMSKESIDKLFMTYEKLNNDRKINPDGTGLGLSICK